MLEMKFRSPMNHLLLLVVLIASSGVGCAYRMGSGDRQIPGGYSAIAVPVFKNMTQETGVEVYFTNAMVREIERTRIGRVVNQTDSQVTLQGVITGITYNSVTQITETASGTGSTGLPSDTVLNAQYRINVALKLRLVRNSDQKTLWEGAFNRERTYLTPRIGIVGPSGGPRSEGLTGANALYNHSARYQNIQVMAVDLVAEAHDRLTEKF